MIIILLMQTSLMAVEPLPQQTAPPRIVSFNLGQTAYVIPHREWLLGPRILGYGVFPHIELHTVPVFDLLGSWNLFLKMNILETPYGAISALGGVAYIDIEELTGIRDITYFKYILGGTISVPVHDRIKIHLNADNSQFSKNLARVLDLKGFSFYEAFTNLRADAEWRYSEKRTIIVGSGWDFASRQLAIGGSHVWNVGLFSLELGFNARPMSDKFPLHPFLNFWVRF